MVDALCVEAVDKILKMVEEAAVQRDLKDPPETTEGDTKPLSHRDSRDPNQDLGQSDLLQSYDDLKL